MRYEERIGMEARKGCFLLALLLVALPSCLNQKSTKPKKDKKKKAMKVAYADTNLSTDLLCDDLIKFFDSDESIAFYDEATKEVTEVVTWADDATVDIVATEEKLTTVYNECNDHSAKDQDAAIAQNAEKVKQVLAAADKRGDKINIIVEGHTDSMGPPHHNRELSTKRATYVAKGLEAAGVAPERIKIVGSGSTSPVTVDKKPVIGSSEEQWLNRRVELHLERVA